MIAGILERLRAGLPQAEIVNGTEVLQEARAQKSAEEVDFIRRADRLAEAALDKMVEMARPGVAEREVFGAMIATTIAGGGEIPSMLLWGAGKQPPWPHRMLTDRVLQAGDMINNEVEAKWGGYIAQVVGPCVLGKADATSREVFARSVDVFQDLCGYMKPGVTFREIRERYSAGVRRSGHEPGAALLHGRGLGEDRPLLSGGGSSAGDELSLEEGMVFILKPAVFPAGGGSVVERDGEIVELAVRAGDTVVVTASGTERLGTRRLALLEL